MANLDLGAATRDHRGEVATIDADGRSSTWLELQENARRWASRLGTLAQREGLGPTDVIGFVAHATPATFALVHALIATGRPFVPLHPRLTPGELERVSKCLGPLLRVEPAALDEVAPPVPALSPPADDERAVAILASSGTSGVPKGVVLSRAAFASAARASAAFTPFGAPDRWLLCMPLAHVGGLSILTRALVARASVMLLPRFDTEHVLDGVREHGVTHLSVVPTMLRDLLAHPRASTLRGLRVLLVGGAACPDELLREARALGCPAIATYGLTEACSQVTTQPLSDRDRAPDGDCGLPLPGTDVKIVDGEILFRGPTQMSGYRGQPVVAEGAWLHTGDMGELRADGRLVVHARRTDLIVTGGENVYPAEVELALRAVEGVLEAVVVGVDDARWGQTVLAIVVLEEGMTEERVLGRASLELAPHKRPRRVLAVDGPIPRTSKGEVDRMAARTRWGRPEMSMER